MWSEVLCSTSRKSSYKRQCWRSGIWDLGPKVTGRLSPAQGGLGLAPRSMISTLIWPPLGSPKWERINFCMFKPSYFEFFCYMQSNLISTHATIKWKLLIYIYINQMQAQVPFCSFGSIAYCQNVTVFPTQGVKKKKKTSKNWYQERWQNMFMLNICNQLWNYYRKVPNRNSLQSPSETHLQYPPAP